MSRRIRPSARRKTLGNVMHSNLSETDKKCIAEVFWEFGKRTKVVRCKECQFYQAITVNGEATGYGLCAYNQRFLNCYNEDFCSNGVRKEEDPNEKK